MPSAVANGFVSALTMVGDKDKPAVNAALAANAIVDF